MKSQRGVSQVGAVVVALMLALVAAPLFMGWVVVDVHTTGADKVDLTVPFPLALARLAVMFAPRDEIAQPVPPEVTRHRETVLAALRQLEACPDTTLVKVDAPDAKVEIATRDGKLVFQVHAEDADVSGALPVAAAIRVLERWDWRTTDPRLAIDFLAAAGHGQLVAVNARDARVSIRVL